MVFHSFIFILLFLPACLIGYFGLNHFHRYTSAKAFLFGMSLWFYGYFHPSYLLILTGSILGNYAVYRLILRQKSREKSAVWTMRLGVLGNLGVLFFFKYADFFLDNINALFGSRLPQLSILLPLGISFFTFQQIGFLVDACRGEAGDYPFLDYALFVSFFPQLVAGPIVTHKALVPQFSQPEKKPFRADNFSAGCVSFIVGLSKKVLLADTFGQAVACGYEALDELNAPGALIVAIAFYFQIYFDFSGYSDMAIGLGRMMNLELPVNFRSPYRARTLREHWKSWHITLTGFFTAYVYIPLGGNRNGKLCTYRNVMIVFFLSGLWHGAAWGFVLWGVLNGVGLVLCRMWEKPIGRALATRIGSAALWFCNMLTVSLLFVFFKAENLHTAGRFFGRLFRGGWGAVPQKLLEAFRVDELWYALKLLHVTYTGYGDLILCIGYLAAGYLIVLCAKNVHDFLEHWTPKLWHAAALGVLFLWCLVNLSGVSTFLYYNF